MLISDYVFSRMGGNTQTQTQIAASIQDGLINDFSFNQTPYQLTKIVQWSAFSACEA